MSLTITRSTLMHAALAYVSPELREFDLLAFGTLRKRTVSRSLSLSSLPPEMLLLIRSHLLPVLIAYFMETSASFLRDYEASLRRLICSQCTFYNEFVYGRDVWMWRLSGPCPCAPHAPLTRRLVNPRQFRDRHHWLEVHLSRQSLRFRGLSSQYSTSPSAIWDMVTVVLSEFGYEPALLSRRDRQSILVSPLPSNPIPQQMAPLVLRRLERGLGLAWDYREPLHTSLGTTPSQTVHCTYAHASEQADAPISPIFLPYHLHGIPTHLSTIFSTLISFVTLFFTVLCYYMKPGALRVL
ncbi:hypothetical protein B0H15DRAFT_191685 [Mycena belliarum]|uniref:Uncharacterized protein n=1 Tax=Mycena belliarum TaxID=1033014 RepID=A0AAD6UIX9_9AGAR|nr:hypothetical protein B0H15DRAFT_191685 [Mycena belliae]